MPCDAQPSWLITYLAGAFTAIVAAAVGHFFAARRERENKKHAATVAKDNRKQDFLGLMSGMRLEAERIVGDRYADEIFPTRLYEVRRESPKIRRDLDSNRQLVFDESVKSLCQLTASQVSDRTGGDFPEGRRRVTEAIDAVIQCLS
jgi:hypothetical protein